MNASGGFNKNDIIVCFNEKYVPYETDKYLSTKGIDLFHCDKLPATQITGTQSTRLSPETSTDSSKLECELNELILRSLDKTTGLKAERCITGNLLFNRSGYNRDTIPCIINRLNQTHHVNIAFVTHTIPDYKGYKYSRIKW